MKYAATFTIADPTGKIAAALATESRSQDRSTVTITKGKSLIIQITAGDAIALKAAVQGIIQLLEVDERMEHIAHG